MAVANKLIYQSIIPGPRSRCQKKYGRQPYTMDALMKMLKSKPPHEKSVAHGKWNEGDGGGPSSDF